MPVIVAAHVLPPLVFALIHGSIAYRVRGILVFVLLCVAIGNFFEHLSIFTGWPFGRYHFTDAMGPKFFQVPILLGLAYIGMGYLSWTVARLILNGGSDLLGLPLFAALVMVSWDVAMDPIWSNLAHAWTWHQGGPYFGVPLSNFAGWYLTVYLIYLLFALYLRAYPAGSPPVPGTFWRVAIWFYAVSAAGNLLVIPSSHLSVVADASGAQWKVSSMLTACALVSIGIMGAYALLALARLKRSEIRGGNLLLCP